MRVVQEKEPAEILLVDLRDMSLAGFRRTRLFSPRALNLVRRLSDVQVGAIERK